jgi:hypothetical protein
VDNDTLVLELGEGEELRIQSPGAVEWSAGVNTGRPYIRVQRAVHVSWPWYYYGRAR